MAEELDNLLAEWASCYLNVFADLYNCVNHVKDCALQAEAHSWEGLANGLNNVAADLSKATYHFAYGSPNLRIKMANTLHWISDNWPTDGPPTEVTMDAILSAMITAEFEQIQTFVGIVDGYRVGIWNEWFNVEYFAALARGFTR